MFENLRKILIGCLTIAVVQWNLASADAGRVIQAGVEFNGPYSTWLNVREFGAIGDGIHDDTQAIEAALKALGLNLAPAAVFFPEGTYRITHTIQFPDASFPRGVLGKLVIGADPATTTLLWDGPKGGDMLWLAGQAHMRYGRLTFDGGGKAEIGIRVERDAVFKLYSSYVQIHDCVFRGSAYGIYNTNRNVTHSMDAEYSILRCTFNGLDKAGIRIDAGNAYNYWIRHCRFTDCHIGVQNTYGDFYVMQSHFERSRQVDIEAVSHRSGGIRDNLSIGSKQFLRANTGRYIVQNNRVLDLKGDIAIDYEPKHSFTGLLAIDNTIYAEHPVAAIVARDTQAGPVALIGNTITENSRIEVAQKNALLLENKTVSANQVDRSIPPLPATPPQVKRPVIEVGKGDVLQEKIDQAAAIAREQPGEQPVVHIAPGEYRLLETLTVPANLPIKIVGDGTGSRLIWAGLRSCVKPLLLLQGPSRVTIQDLAFSHSLKQGDSFRSPVADILIDQADQSGARIVSDNSWLAGVFADRLQNTRIDLLDNYSCNYGGWLYTTLKAVGPEKPGASRIAMLGGVCIGDQIFAHVVDGGRILIRDFWHEQNTVMKHPWLLAEGKGVQPGEATIESGYIYQIGRQPLLQMRGFAGTMALMANSFGGNSDLIEVAGPAQDTGLLSLLGWARLQQDTGEPGSVFAYDGRNEDRLKNLKSFDSTLTWLREIGPEPVMQPRPAGVTDVRMHRITALYQNGWGLWVRPDSHDATKNGVSVTATVWDAYDYDNRTGRFTFTRDTSETELTVKFAVEGAADLQKPLGNTITFPKGVSQVDLDVLPVKNNKVDGDHSVRVRLLPGDGYSCGVPRQCERDRVFIHDTDMQQHVWLSPERATISEDPNSKEGQTAKFTLYRNHPYGDLEVHYSLDGTAGKQDFEPPLSGVATIPDGKSSTEVILKAKDNNEREPVKTLTLKLDKGEKYKPHPQRQTTATVTILEDDPINLVFAKAEHDSFVIQRNGKTGRLKVPYTFRSGAKTLEAHALIPAGDTKVAITLPEDVKKWPRPISVSLQPIPDSTMAKLAIPQQASRYWWAVSPENVVAIDLQKTEWTSVKSNSGKPAIAFAHQAPEGWLPADTPSMGTSVAYDPVDDRLWVLVAFSRPNSKGPEQTLWRIEAASTPQVGFNKHAVFGQVERGVAFTIQLDGQRDVLLTYGSTGNNRIAARVQRDGKVFSEKGEDVASFTPDPDGGIWGAMTSRFGREGLMFWPTETGFPNTTGQKVLSGFGGHVMAVTALPALVRDVLRMGRTVAYSQRFSTVQLVDTVGTVKEMGVPETKNPGGTTRILWDPLGRLWLRPQNSRLSGVIIDPVSTETSGQNVAEIFYTSVVSFDNDYAYIQQSNGTLQRISLKSSSVEQVKLVYQDKPLLISSDGDPTGYHWYRATQRNPLPTLELP